MLLQSASLKVGSMRTGYTASASSTNTTSAVGRVGAGSGVAQVSNLPYRRFVIGRAWLVGERWTGPSVRGLQTRDTGDCKSALLCTSIRAANSLPVASVTRNRL